MEYCIRFVVNIGACMNGLSSTIGIYGFYELKLQPFLNMPIKPGIILSGTRLSLVTEPSLVLS